MYGTGFYTRGLASPVWPIPLFLLTTPLHILFHLFLCDGGPSCLEKYLKRPVLWPPHAKSWLLGKDSDAGRDWGQEERGTTEDEMAGWHHRLDGRESEWTPGVGDGQGGLVCCNSWGRKESDTTERLNWTDSSAASVLRDVPLSLFCRC